MRKYICTPILITFAFCRMHIEIFKEPNLNIYHPDFNSKFGNFSNLDSVDIDLQNHVTLYRGDVYIGQPSQKHSFDFDTGSDAVWMLTEESC